MSLKKNISGGPLDVPLLDRVVEADETVEVPDFQPGHTEQDPLPIVWPPDKWEAAAEPKAITDKPAGDGTAQAAGRREGM